MVLNGTRVWTADVSGDSIYQVRLNGVFIIRRDESVVKTVPSVED